MNVLNDIGDVEFVPFLQSLGVDTYKKSFEWMLNEPDFSGVLRWLYNNLDHNNALTAREEYRYAEIEKRGQLMSPKDLELAVADLQEEYKELCLAGDKEAMEDTKMDLKMQKERLDMLEKQEAVIKELLKRNDLLKEELNLEVTKLHSAEQQCKEDEATAAEECLQLAEEVENITEEVVDVVADALDVYNNCNSDKELSQRFFTFGPFESYRQSQALFRSHFDLFTTKKFGNHHKNTISDEELQAVLAEAKTLEERLADAAFAYIESKAELTGEQAKVALVSNYNNVHPSRISSCLMEAQSALELLEQEEAILEQQVQDAVRGLADERTRLAVDAAATAALVVREQIHRDISHLWECSSQALTLDRLLYCALRQELHTMQQLLQFTAQLRQHVTWEGDAVVSRIESMNRICSERALCEQKLLSSDILTDVLCKIFGVESTNDALVLLKTYNDLQSSVVELKQDIADVLRNKEDGLGEFKKSMVPLREYIFSGCTRQPKRLDRTVASMIHRLVQEMAAVDKKVLEASSKFTSVKNGDKHNLRKLWQWFLTDPSQLAAAK